MGKGSVSLSCPEMPACTVRIRVWAATMCGHMNYMYDLVSDMKGCGQADLAGIFLNVGNWARRQCDDLWKLHHTTMMRCKKGNGWRLRLKIRAENRDGNVIFEKWYDAEAAKKEDVRFVELSCWDVVYGKSASD